MKRLLAFACVSGLMLAGLSSAQSPQGIMPLLSTAIIEPNFGGLPLSFVGNEGQTDPSVRFLAHTAGGTLFFAPHEVVLSLPDLVQTHILESRSAEIQEMSPASTRELPVDAPSVIRLRFEGTDGNVQMIGSEPLPGVVSYFRGDEPADWHIGLSTYSTIVYEDLYPGIDLHYSGTAGLLESTYIVAPGAEPARIHWRYEGASDIQVEEATGELLIGLSTAIAEETRGQNRSLVEHNPIAWQVINGQEVPVSIRYRISEDESIGFLLGNYDPRYPLIIDPILEFGTYLGGSVFDIGTGIAVDSIGNVYVTGYTESANFPGTSGSPIQPTHSGEKDVFVAKLDASGTAFDYVTYLGGTSYDLGLGIAVDGNGNAYVAGYTESPDFPGASSSPIQPTLNGVVNAFVVRVNPQGTTLDYSTYLGGGTRGTRGWSIAVDGDGNAYVAGYTDSPDFPGASSSPIQPTLNGALDDIFVAKVNPEGTALDYSTYLGGSGDERTPHIAVDGNGNAYVTGRTYSTDFLGTSDSPIQSSRSGTGDFAVDAFVVRVNAGGTALGYSTYLGGIGTDWGEGITVDGNGNAYVTGLTTSPDFPGALTSPIQPNLVGETNDAFLVRVNAGGTALDYSTYLGGTGTDMGTSVAIDSNGNAYVAGYTDSPDFPGASSSPIQPTLNGGADAFVVRVNSGGTVLDYSTYLGGSGFDVGYGIAVDSNSNAYVTGMTNSSDFPGTQVSTIQAVFGGGAFDAFVAKISHIGPPPNLPPLVTADQPALVADEGQIAVNGGTVSDPDGDPMTLSASIGTVTNNDDGTWSWSFPTSDGPSQSQTVTVSVDDGNGNVGEASFTLMVVNIAPTVNVGSDATILEGETFTGAGFFIDPGSADTWIAIVDYGDGSGRQPLMLTGNTFSLSHTYTAAGSFSVTVTVTDDDGGAGDAHLIVNVQTPQQATQDIVADVQSLVSSGVLNQGQGNALIAKLEAAIRKMEQGNLNAASNQLQAFINQINDFINAGTLAPEVGQPLIDAASAVISAIGS